MSIERTSGLIGKPICSMKSSVSTVGRELRPADHLTELVGPERQPPLGGHRRILLAQAAGGGIARVDERAFTGRFVFDVERLEHRRRHVHLAPHLDDLRHVGTPEPLGYVLDGAHVARDVLADPAIAAGRGLHEQPVLVAQAHRQAVDLELGHEARHDSVEPLHDPIGPGPQLVAVHRVVEAGHRHRVGDRRKCGAGGSTDLLGRRFGIGQLGIFGFERSQLAGEHVEIAIEQLGCVELVVQPVVMGDLAAKFGDPFADGGHLRGLRHRTRV